MFMDNVTFLFISPHLDDVVMSCGGYINCLTAQGIKVIIATIVTADYNSGLPMSRLAQRGLRAWGLGNRPFVIRRGEDKAAAKVLGAEVVHFDFLDCIYRQDKNNHFLYTKRVRDVPVHPLDWEIFEPTLQTKLREYFQQYSTNSLRIVCPLSIGGHVDHILVRHAVESVSDPQARIYYEDFPYTLRSKANKNHLQLLKPYTTAISREDIQARLIASACYVSQIPGLFPSQLEMVHEIMDARLPATRRLFPIQHDVAASVRRMNIFIREYSKEIGGERYWANSNSFELYGIPQNK
jgi:LmbE family N-acetylglucosaminyl deacetylase